jgi:hypothetical protein
MPWYKAGSVSVVQNSNAVTGAGTAFIGNSRVGDAFLGPDGCWYEVINIASDTAMAISPSYRSVTISTGTYAVVPIQGYPKALADAFNGLNNEFGSTLAALGTTGNYDILPMSKGGTEASNAEDSRENLGLGEVATEDILPIEKGGTGATTDASALEALGGIRIGAANSSAGTSFCSGAPPRIAEISSTGNDGKTALRIANETNVSASAVMTFMRETVFGVHFGLDTDNRLKVGGLSMGAVARAIYHEGNILGVVSLSGSTPTGAIIEQGATSSGQYTKFADGTLICRGLSNAAFPANTPANGIFYSQGIGFVFPVAFSQVPSVALQTVTSSTFFCWAASEGSASNAGITGRVISPVNGGSSYLSYIAIGRWV